MKPRKLKGRGVYKKKPKQKPILPVFDVDGWAKADLYKPDKYELVLLVDAKGKRQNGWWNGSMWDFGKKKIGDRIVAWKKSEYKN
jgi:hypothetical protein